MADSFERNPSIPQPPPPPHLSKDQKAIWPHEMPKAPPAPGSAEELAAKDAQDAAALAEINEQTRAEEAERITYIKETFGEKALEQMAGTSKTMYEATQKNASAVAEQQTISSQERGNKVAKYLDDMRQFTQWFGVTRHESSVRTLEAKNNLARAVKETTNGERKAYNEATTQPVEGLDPDTKEWIEESAKLVPGRELYRLMQEDLVAIGKQSGSTAEKNQHAQEYLTTMSKFSSFFDTMVPHNLREDAAKSLQFTQENYDKKV